MGDFIGYGGYKSTNEVLLKPNSKQPSILYGLLHSPISFLVSLPILNPDQTEEIQVASMFCSVSLPESGRSNEVVGLPLPSLPEAGAPLRAIALRIWALGFGFRAWGLGEWTN